MARWTCDHCGATGEVPPGETSDQVLCSVCGEPVLPDQGRGVLPARSYVVQDIRRFPVKAMGGESLSSAVIDTRGLVGDRAYAVVDGDGKLASGKHTRRFRRRDEVFDFASRSTGEGVRVTGSGGEWPAPSDDLDLALSEAMGDPVRVLPETTTPYFDVTSVSLIGTASLDWCREHLHVDADPRRLRPNLVVDTDEPFVEETWTGASRSVGCGCVPWAGPSGAGWSTSLRRDCRAGVGGSRR